MMDRDECVQALVNIRAMLELVADTAAKYWSPADHRWVELANPPGGKDFFFDLAKTLTTCFRDNDIGSVLQWIEFNVTDGPARRERLIKALRVVRDEIRHIECGNPCDPFRWMRESIDGAAAKVAGQVTQVADYVGQVLTLVEAVKSDWEAGSPAQWAKRFDVSLATFSRMRKRGDIRSREISSKRILVHRDDVSRHEKK